MHKEQGLYFAWEDAQKNVFFIVVKPLREEGGGG